MDRELILKHLAQTEQYIGTSECEAARLRQDLARLERAGDVPIDVRQALQRCEQLQAAHRVERARLLAELSTTMKAAQC